MAGKNAVKRQGRGARKAPGASSANSFRTVGILAQKYLIGYAKNPATVVATLIPIGAGILFRFVSAGEAYSADIATWLDMFYALYTFSFAGLMIAAMHVMYDMGEEAEKGGVGVLLRSGVTRGQMAAARLAATGALLITLCVASCAILKPNNAVALVGVGAACQLPIIVIGCALGLFARTQNDVLLTSTPLILAALAPFVLYMTADPLALSVASFIPTGGMLGLAEAILAGDVFGGQGPLCLAMSALWLAVSAGYLAWALRRITKRDAAAQEQNA